MYKNQNLGKLGEDLAVRYLTAEGYQIIQRNFLCRQGEIDIIVSKDEELIFVEVKTRTSLKYGDPIEAVTETKQKHIKKAIKYYLYKNSLNNSFIRIDVIEIYIYKNKYKVNHIKQVI